MQPGVLQHITGSLPETAIPLSVFLEKIRNLPASAFNLDRKFSLPYIPLDF